MVSLNSGFREEKTYQAYDINNVYKCNKETLKETIEQVLRSGKRERILIELPNTIGLTDEIINQLPNNVDVRVIGGLTEEYAKGHKTNDLDNLREKATYSKEELLAIMAKIKQIEAGMAPDWNDYEKALYLFEYLKVELVYRTTRDKDLDGKTLDKLGDRNRIRTWDSLMGLVSGISTCSGFAHIYQELCTRNHIECVKVCGKYDKTSHVWNLVTMNNQTFFADIIFDAKEYEKGIDQTTRFGMQDISHYTLACYQDKLANFACIDQKWVKQASEKVKANIPKEKMVIQKIKHFMLSRERERQRLIELIQAKENQEVYQAGGVLK